MEIDTIVTVITWTIVVGLVLIVFHLWSMWDE